MEKVVTFLPVAKSGDRSPNLGQIYANATRELLRFRLIVATITTLAFLGIIKIVSIANGSFTINLFLTRSTALIVLAAIIWVVANRKSLSLVQLHLLGVVVFAIPVVEGLFVLVQEVDAQVSSESLTGIPTIFALVSFAIAILIAIYAMYISMNWIQTLVVGSIASLSPAITALVHQALLDVPLKKYPGLFAPLLTVSMAAVATTAARFIQQVRKEAAEAKQYGQYHLTKKIGEGAMGVVYRAEHRLLSRPAAVKLIRKEAASKPDALENFEHEVQLAATLTHWNTVQVYDFGRTNEGEFYYVMEFLEGLTLEQRIRRSKLTPQEAIQVFSQVCDGLSEAHGIGMIHRDLKPANLILTEIGDHKDVVKILDFGVAAMISESSRLQSLGGTPAYMSPEQIQGKDVDFRSDIYALGLMIYESLVGKRLMVADSVDELLKKQINESPTLEEVPQDAAGFVDIIEKCIQKDPKLRYLAVGELRVALSALA